MKFSRIALLSAASLAVAQPHQHAHRHPARHGSPVEARDAVATVTMPGAMVTVYELNGKVISQEDVEAGIKSGKYVLVNGQVSSVISAPVQTAAPATSAAPSSAAPAPSSSVQAAQFIEKAKSSSAAPSSTYVAPVSSATSAAAPASSSSSSSSGSTSTGNWEDFPSGTIDCSAFPSQYGPVALDYLKFGGWAGIQNVPNFSGSLGSLGGLISYIETATTGSTCTENSFCSYACPAGYQKAQWPEKNQGATGQSIGGLYCNSQGKLELTRTSVKALCTKGTGGVTIKSSVGNVISVCRTDYPGTESETIPLAINNGDDGIELTNPDTNDYYSWEGSSTSAQYYLNPSNNPIQTACWWNVAGSNLGNYAPANLGTSSTNGVTFLSVFGNYPTLTDFTTATLDYNVNFIVDGVSNDKCKYENKQFYANGKVTDHTGCTVSLTML